MKVFKSLLIILISFLVVSLAFSTTSVFAHEGDEPQEEATESGTEVVEEINSFELFWPIVAGKVQGESLYSLKSFKESIREFFIFSSLRKADYNITLSEKRAVEAEKLYLEKEDWGNGQKTLEAAQAKRERALVLIDETAAKGQPVVDIKNRFASSLGKQNMLLNYIAGQLPEEQHAVVDGDLEKIDSILSELQ